MAEVAGVCHRILRGAICEGIMGQSIRCLGMRLRGLGKWAPSAMHPPANVQPGAREL
jgi:hypothetical protein